MDIKVQSRGEPAGVSSGIDGRGVDRDAGANLGSSFQVLFDKTFAVLALLFFSPFFAVISLVIWINQGGPVVFAHKRIGKDGKPFNCLKFRTMTLNAEAQLEELLAKDPVARAQWAANQKLDDDPRITCIGEFFRKTSLDELPQFWNVLRGDMAIVGPRPIVEAEMFHYGADIDTYLSVKPGITGSWQVSGRSTTSYDERVKLDTDYVRSRTFLKDIEIILKTIWVMIARDGGI